MSQARTLNWLCVGLLSTLGLTACSKPAAPLEQPLVLEPSATTRWVRSRPASEVSMLDAPARVLPSPQAAAAVSPPLRGRVMRVRVQAGQRVEKGEPLVDVLMPELVQAAGAFSAAMLKVDAYVKRKAQLDALKSEGLVRSDALAEVEAQLATLRADAQAARATLRAAGLADRQVETLLSSDGVIHLAAPISGIVTAVDTVPGEVREPSGHPLVELAGEGDVRIEARLPSVFIEGARFIFVTTTAVPLALELVSLSPRVESNDGARLAWFQLAAGAKPPPAGTSGRVRLVANPAWRAVPARSLSTGAAEAKVLVRRGAKVEAVPVRVVATSGAEAVVDGLPEDAEVAADAQAVEGAR